MSYTAFFGVTAGLLNLAAFFPYILAIFGWRIGWNPILQRTTPTRPNRATWFIWAFVGAVILPAYSHTGAEETIWVPGANLVGPIVVALLSVRWGEGGWTKFDQACVLGAALSALVWAITGSAIAGLLLALVSDGFGTAATVRHAYRRPDEESRFAWALFFIGDLVNLFAITDWSWSAFPVWILPIYMVASVTPIVIVLWRRSMALHNPKQKEGPDGPNAEGPDGPNAEGPDGPRILR